MGGTPLSRRTLLAIQLGALVRAQQAAGPPAHVKGPKVYLDYDQAELDAMYDQTVYAPNAAQVRERYVTNSAAIRQRLGEPQRLSYGPSEIEKLDIFRAPGRSSSRQRLPVHIFIHGGAWRAGAASDFQFPAGLFVAAGAHFVVPDFSLVQDAGGDLRVMESQVRRAIEWVSRNAAQFGGDSRRIFASGHSSGAQLLSAALTSLPRDMVRGALLVSGMYDLRGARLSSRSSYVKIDDAAEDSLSARRHIDKIRVPLIVAYGSKDNPEFQRQSREFAAALSAAGKSVESITGEGYNHFEFIETLATPSGVLGRAALKMMGLG